MGFLFFLLFLFLVCQFLNPNGLKIILILIVLLEIFVVTKIFFPATAHHIFRGRFYPCPSVLLPILAKLWRRSRKLKRYVLAYCLAQGEEAEETRGIQVGGPVAGGDFGHGGWRYGGGSLLCSLRQPAFYPHVVVRPAYAAKLLGHTTKRPRWCRGDPVCRTTTSWRQAKAARTIARLRDSLEPARPVPRVVSRLPTQPLPIHPNQGRP